MGGPGEVLRGQRGAVCHYFEQGGAAVTEGGQLAPGFCNFYSQVGPKLSSRLGKEREGAYLEYMGRQVEESLIWRPTNPDEVEKLRMLERRQRGMGSLPGW